MVRDLIINVSILISFVSIASHLMKERDINAAASIKIKLVTGLISGILGIAAIYFGFHPTENTVIDFRNIVLTMSSIYGGVIPVIICGLSIAVFRITYFGAVLSSFAAIITTAVICIADIIISRQKLKISTRWILASAFNTLAISCNLWYLLGNNPRLLEMLLTYCIASAMVSLLTFRYVNYCLTANMLYRQIKKESTKDFLTGLNNVRSFDRMFNETIEAAVSKNEQVSLLMVDIDYFKKVNDTYGHHQGDIVLKELGKILMHNSRSFDIVSRNGGEEFTVILLDCDTKQAYSIAERIRTNVEASEFVLLDNTKIKITVSIGVANYPDSTPQQENLLELADSALYKAKRTGRNRIVLAEPIAN